MYFVLKGYFVTTRRNTESNDMKKVTSFFVFAIIVCNCVQAQTPNAQVDERVELLSIVFRLAGAKEYTSSGVEFYDNRIDSLFSPFKEHELIKYAALIRQVYGIGQNAVMSFAIHIEIKEGEIDFIKNAVDDRLDKRWTQRTARQFLKRLNDFYKKSKFHDFYLSQQSLYLLAEERFENISDKVDFNWFEKFYGKKLNGKFHLILSMCNGGNNYGANIKYKDGTQDIFAIMGLWKVDSSGYPVYASSMQATVIHEYNHFYCNSLIDEFYPQMEAQAKVFFEPVKQKMQQQAYGNPQIMLYEIMVRASVIEYYIEKGLTHDKINFMINREKVKGFLWIDKLVEALSEYRKHRNEYVALIDFMPKIVELFGNLSSEKVYAEYIENAVKIVGTSIPNNAGDIDPNTNELTVFFNKPMNDGHRGFSYGKKGKEYFPEVLEESKTPTWNKDKTAITIYSLKLKPNTEYSLSVPNILFVGQHGEPVLETYYLDFKTK
jgi:hypothetical protein